MPTDTGGYEIHPEAASIKDLKGTVPQPVGVDQMNEAIAAAATADAR